MTPSNTPFLFVITDHPLDYPNHWVVRPRTFKDAPYPVACLCDSLDEARQPFVEGGNFLFDRDPLDDPVIVEFWI